MSWEVVLGEGGVSTLNPFPNVLTGGFHVYILPVGCVEQQNMRTHSSKTCVLFAQTYTAVVV